MVGIRLAEVVLGDIDVGGECGAAEGSEIDFHGDMSGELVMCGESGGGGDFLLVALAVVEAEGVAGVAGVNGNAEGSGGIEAAGEENDGGFGHEGSLTEASGIENANSE